LAETGGACRFAANTDLSSIILKVIHTATPDTTKLSCLYRVRFGGVNWIPGNSRLSPTENLKFEHVNDEVYSPQMQCEYNTKHKRK